MSSTAIAGADSLSVNGRNMADFADADFVKVTFPTDRVMVKRSKNGNTIFAINEMGGIADMELRLLIGSSDDKFMNSLFLGMEADISTFNLLAASFSKRVGDGKGNVTVAVYQLTGGVFKRRIEVISSAEGSIEQSIAVYHLQFGDAPRSIQ
jgi:hypothetical protein